MKNVTSKTQRVERKARAGYGERILQNKVKLWNKRLKPFPLKLEIQGAYGIQELWCSGRRIEVGSYTELTHNIVVLAMKAQADYCKQFTFDTKMDTNGNRVLTIAKRGFKAFSVQTLQNLPEVHRNYLETGKIPVFENEQILRELLQYVKEFGTDNQKRILELL